MTIKIRPGHSDDLPSLLSLIKELAAFEKRPDAVKNSLSRMQDEVSYFNFFVAEENGRIVGAAVYFFAYYTWVGKSLYVDDLYVKSEYRNKQVGTRLLKKILEVAKSSECKRVRWQVLDWNTNAISFYKKLGANVSGEWLNCDLEEADINKLCSSLQKVV